MKKAIVVLLALILFIVGWIGVQALQRAGDDGNRASLPSTRDSTPTPNPNNGEGGGENNGAAGSGANNIGGDNLGLASDDANQDTQPPEATPDPDDDGETPAPTSDPFAEEGSPPPPEPTPPAAIGDLSDRRNIMLMQVEKLYDEGKYEEALELLLRDSALLNSDTEIYEAAIREAMGR